MCQGLCKHVENPFECIEKFIEIYRKMYKEPCAMPGWISLRILYGKRSYFHGAGRIMEDVHGTHL